MWTLKLTHWVGNVLERSSQVEEEQREQKGNEKQILPFYAPV